MDEERSMDSIASHKRRFEQDGSMSEGSSSATTTKSMQNGKPKPKRKRKPLDKLSEEYKRRREKNNEAVKKSRIKSKVKTIETQEQVSELNHEHELLTQKVQSLKKEFELLKELYQAHAKNPDDNNEVDLSSLMAPDAGEEPKTQKRRKK